MTMNARLPVTIVVLCLGVAVLAGAESPPSGAFGEQVDVQLVNVELFATDRHGDPVFDLKEEEIRVFEDGEPVAVTHFRPPAGTPSSVETTGRNRAMGRSAEVKPVRVVVFVDNLNTGPASRTRVLEQTWAAMEEGLDAKDEVMVVSFDGSLQVQMEFSRDRKELRRTLEYVSTLAGDRLLASLRDRNALEAIQWETESNADGPCVFVGQLARQHADVVNHQVQRTLAALETFIGSLAGVPGRKVLLHVSDGIPLIPGAEAWDHAIALCDGTGGMQGVPAGTVANQLDGTPNRFDPKTAVFDRQSYDTSDQWRRLAALANAHQVVFYPLFAPGLVAPLRSNVDSVPSTLRNENEFVLNRQDTLSILADETGGEVDFRTNDFNPVVGAAIDESLTSYEMAFVPLTPGDGKVHSIRVEADRPGVTLRYRKSYQSKSDRQRVQDRILSTLFYGFEDNPLEARVQAVPARDRIVADKIPVEIRVSLPLENLVLLPEGEMQTGLFTVYVAAREGSGETRPVGRRTIPVQIPVGESAGRGEEFRYVVEMEVDVEPSTIAVALRDEIGGEASFLRAEIDPAR